MADLRKAPEAVSLAEYMIDVRLVAGKLLVPFSSNMPDASGVESAVIRFPYGWRR